MVHVALTASRSAESSFGGHSPRFTLGGLSVAYCKRKTRYLAEVSIEQFLRSNPRKTYFYTFTEPGRKEGEPFWTKTQAEEKLKPFLDKLRREKASFLVFWERQKRGAWHPHILLNRRFEVNGLRAFMMARGWGSQMYLKHVTSGLESDGSGPRIGVTRLTRYLVKYLTKASTDDQVEPGKKFFGGSHTAKAGNVKFKWAPWFEPTAMLFFFGARTYFELHGEPPGFHSMAYVIRLGVEACDWLSVDPWWMPFG